MYESATLDIFWELIVQSEPIQNPKRLPAMSPSCVKCSNVFQNTTSKIVNNPVQYIAVFHVHVILRNDETPSRAVDRVFHVVEGGQKRLTGDDLRFVDLDVDTRPEDIRYNHRSIPNGELVLVDDPSRPIFHFTQKEQYQWGQQQWRPLFSCNTYAGLGHGP